jgi:hypothetical protein
VEEFIVHVIESPKPMEILEGRQEQVTLYSALEDTGIRVEAYTVVDEETLFRAFKMMGECHYEYDEEEEPFPILHISAHGSKDGIELTSGDFLAWKRLGDLLVPFNEATGDVLVVGMSTCFGFQGLKMARRISGSPFYALVGPVGDVGWDDTKVGFVTFYHLVARKGWDLNPAVEVMNTAAGVKQGTFQVVGGEKVQLEFRKKVREVVGTHLLGKRMRGFAQQLGRRRGS